MHTAVPIRSRSNSASPQPKKIRLELEDVRVIQPKGRSTLAPHDTSASFVTAPPETSVSKAPSSTVNKRKRKQRKQPVPDPGTPEDVIWQELVTLLGASVAEEAIQNETEWSAPVPLWEEVQLDIVKLSSTGDGIALLTDLHPPWAVLVPFTLPNERVRARIHRHSRLHSLADLVEVITPNSDMRDMSRVQCKYFGKCGGCQYQMLSYDTQLQLKQDVVRNAYRHFSGLASDSIPDILPTIPSPKEYGYRTKITPHFDARPKRSKTQNTPWELRIGFDEKGRRSVLDIEECPIATDVLNEALGPIRQEVHKNLDTYKRGATLLLRDSLSVPSTSAQPIESEVDHETHICITSHKDTVREKVGSTIFEFPAGSFFQNNNSVLEPLTTYVRDAIFVPTESTTGFTCKPTHLVDTYCGSGLFSLTLSPYFEHIVGIEIDANSIRFANHNLSLNSLPTSKHAFHAGKSEDIFSTVLQNSASTTPFPPESTVVIIDPPRKGCDSNFLDQLISFRPSTLVYVSCNVHTQARDVGILVTKTEGDGQGRRYKVESLRGFDLFPQTSHVEGVAVLRLV